MARHITGPSASRQTTHPCQSGLGNAFQMRGTLRAVPPLIGDLGEQAPLDPHPGVAVRPGPHRSTLAYRCVREQAHLQGPLDTVKNLVNRLHP
ncbi:hypothetical protein GCM10010270_22650 [Streptomyces violaceus]|nr:hypothetical protein GCM10010270_22650 [Streptomyces janthinus]